jgi:hypothetical protein
MLITPSKFRLYLSALFLALLSITGWPQETTTADYDTVFVSEGSVITIGKKSFQPLSDTLLILPHGTKYAIKEGREKQSQDFYDSLQLRASGSRWARELHNIVIRTPKRGPITDTLQTSASVLPYLTHTGKIIREIKVQKLEPFGPSIFDTVQYSLSNIENLGNDLHVLTKDHKLYHYILFKPGEAVNPSVMADNERIIRKLPFIEDARIYIQEVPGETDYVDILILTKDNFSIGLGGEIQDINAGKLELFEKNFLGYGHQLHYLVHWDGDRKTKVTHEFFHIVNNIGGTFINSKLRYARIFETQTYEAEFARPFNTPNMKYAGALRFERTSTEKNILYIDSLTELTPIEYNQFDNWIGRSFALTSREIFTKNRINLVLATRFLKYQFFDRPQDVTEATLYNFHNRTYLISSISLTQQRFFRSNLIYSFGRTEDIPHGLLISFTAGPEFNEFGNRIYLGSSIARGGLIGNLGYMYSRVECGGFLDEIDHFNQGVFNTSLDYFSNLFIINRFKVRHFLKLQYTRGINRYLDEYITINDSYGITGFKDDRVKGLQKFTANYEAVSFSPYYFFDFRFAFFGFLDVGLISTDEPLLMSKPHSGYWFGVRIKNERLVFETIQLRLGYYPTISDIQFPFRLDFSGEKRLNPTDFYVTKPDVVKFQ